MAFDEEGFRKAAKQAGLSDSEIENEIKFQSGSSKQDDGFQLSSIEEIQQRIGNDWWHLPAGLAIGGAAAGFAMSKLFGKPEEPSRPRIEPTMGPIPEAEPKPMSPMEVLQQRKEQLMGARANVPQAPVQPPAAVAAPAAPVQPPVAPAVTAPAAPAIADAVAAGESPAKAIQMDVAKQIEASPMLPPPEAPAETGIKKRAAKTPVTFKSPEKLPEGISFRADLGPGDNWLFNTYGPEGRKAILNQFNEGKPAVSYERAKELSQLLQQERVGPVIPRDIAKERGVAPPQTNYGKLGKAVKVAGVAGLGLTAAQMAQAAQQAREGDYSAAREFGFNLLGMIPGLGAAFNLGTYAPEAGAGEQKELAKRRRMAPTVD